MNKIVNICFITDKKYVIPTGVAVQSLINNKNKDTLYNINIICTDLDQDQTKSFEKLNTYNVNVSVINTGNKYENIGFEHVYVSKAAMLKFDLPNILPNIDKVLYLDGDMLIFDDLSSLYDIDLKNKYAAVVKDMAGMYAGHHTKMKHKDYFNSGMMLLNLKKMRKEDTTSKLLYAKKHDEYKNFMDQDALNQVFNENVIYVSPKYNYMKANLNYTSDEIAKFYKIKKSELEQISQKPTILHLTNIKKPWSCKDAPCFNIWQKYYKMYIVKTKGNLLLNYFTKYKLRFDKNSTIKGNFIFTKEKLPNGRRHIYICGIKVASYMKKNTCIISKDTIDIQYIHGEDLTKLLIDKFYEKFGKMPNEELETLNEKITWMAMFDVTPLKTICADKFTVRDYITKTIGDSYLIPLYSVFDDVKDIKFDDLPEKFVVKYSEGSSKVFIVPDKNKLDINHLKSVIKGWADDKFWTRFFEMQYKDSARKIIIEEFIDTKIEYKLWCFNGKCKFIKIEIMNDFAENGKPADQYGKYFYNDWSPTDFKTIGKEPDFEIPKPRKLKELLKIAEKLAEPFDFVRVDFYETNNGDLKFGELTFSPAAGQIHFIPESKNKEFGKLLQIPLRDKQGIAVKSE